MATKFILQSFFSQINIEVLKNTTAVHWNESSKTKAFKIPGQVQMRSQTYVY